MLPKWVAANGDSVKMGPKVCGENDESCQSAFQIIDQVQERKLQ